MKNIKQIIYILKIRIIQYYYNINNMDLYLYDSTELSPEKNGLDPNYVYRSTPTDPFTLKRFIKRLILTNQISKDNIIDIGCGKGASLNMFLGLKFKNISGIEINSKVFSIAKNNFKNKANVKVYHDNALNFKFYSLYTNFFLYNPFPSIIFEEWLNCILSSKKGSIINIVYANDSCSDILFKNGFEKKDSDIDIWCNSISYYTLNKVI